MGFGARAGDVGEEEDDVGSGGYGVEEVAAGARGVVARVQIELFDRRQSRGQGSAGWLGVILHGWWRLYFVGWEGPKYFLLAVCELTGAGSTYALPGSGFRIEVLELL